ncbi:hypothetical protein K439DRAFT_461926 [Ramaria rubella]|nr:hypothetical protein K439DRAFT_461926 [Ramaria rubella]
MDALPMMCAQWILTLPTHDLPTIHRTQHTPGPQPQGCPPSGSSSNQLKPNSKNQTTHHDARNTACVPNPASRVLNPKSRSRSESFVSTCAPRPSPLKLKSLPYLRIEIPISQKHHRSAILDSARNRNPNPNRNREGQSASSHPPAAHSRASTPRLEDLGVVRAGIRVTAGWWLPTTYHV